MIKLLFDGSAMQSSKQARFHGGGEYAKFIFKTALSSGFKFDIVLKKNLYIDKEIQTLIQDAELKTFYVSCKKEMYNLIEEEKYDIFYSALPYEYYDYNSSAKFIGVIHGLRQIEIVWDKYKHKFYKAQLKRLFGACLSHSPFILKIFYKKRKNSLERLLKLPNSEFIVVSNHTKYALLSYFPFLNYTKIKVIYSPFEVNKINLNQIDERQANLIPYFLIVSGNRFEKNTYRAIKAFDQLFSDGRLNEFNVKITGALDLPFASQIKHKDRFHLLPYVSKKELDLLYQQAYCFVYPSLNEGFGYPPVLSMYYGTPVIASACTSIPEICDNAAVYFNPYSIEELKNRILQITYNASLYNDLIKKGYRRVEILLEKQRKDIEDYIKYLFQNTK